MLHRPENIRLCVPANDKIPHGHDSIVKPLLLAAWLLSMRHVHHAIEALHYKGLSIIALSVLLFHTPSLANETSVAASPYSPFISGALGLNTVPNARMDAPGTIRTGFSTLDPYTHGFLGVQVAKPLYISLRQSFESSNIFKDSDRLSPGIDLKARLLKENRSRPEIAVGLQSAVGHKRTAGEYLALSKRYNKFDFTAGLGWGRFGTAGHFTNPLKSLSSHFGRDRDVFDETPSDPTDWFTGDDVSLFGGVEYFTPLRGLSLKFDYGADTYSAERATSDFNAPAPWSVGFNYQPKPWVNAGLAIQGNDKLMGRVSFNTNIANLRDHHRGTRAVIPMRKYRTDLSMPEQMELSAQRENILLQDATTDYYDASARLALDPELSSPYQLGRAAVHMSNHAGPAVESLTIRPQILGLQGPTVSLKRKDLEQANHNQGSSDEIWNSVVFNTDKPHAFKRINRSYENLIQLERYKLTLDNQISLSEEDSGVLYRNSVLLEHLASEYFGFLDSGFALRLNVKDNLLDIRKFRPRVANPVRSDVDLFAQRTIALEHAYSAITHSFKPDLHLALIGGYLEEQYAGFGGELLYRPFKSRFAFGVEGWNAYKRDPFTVLNQGITGSSVLSGHINTWYDLPHHDMTLKAKVGRYLGEDFGGELSLHKNFKNGAKLEAFAGYSDQADFDVLGGTTHGQHGIRLTLPLGGYKYAPRNTQVKLRVEPFARDTGQSIASPLPLYELTEPFSYDHLAQHWDRITPRAIAQDTKIQTKKSALGRTD